MYSLFHFHPMMTSLHVNALHFVWGMNCIFYAWQFAVYRPDSSANMGTERARVVHYNQPSLKLMYVCLIIFRYEQGKSEGFESCDWPIVRKRPICVKIGDALYRVTLKFDGWPWKTIGHLSFAVSSFVQHFIAIGEFKLELQSGNAHFGSNSTIFRAVWPWNLTDDLEKQ